MAKKKLVKGLWPKADINTLKRLFSDHATAEIAAKLGRSTETVKKKASRLGLRKSKKYMKSLGRG
jgi:DNA-directed RNA polymerase specialized sigma24 family protein